MEKKQVAKLNFVLHLYTFEMLSFVIHVTLMWVFNSFLKDTF